MSHHCSSGVLRCACIAYAFFAHRMRAGMHGHVCTCCSSMHIKIAAGPVDVINIALPFNALSNACWCTTLRQLNQHMAFRVTVAMTLIIEQQAEHGFSWQHISCMLSVLYIRNIYASHCRNIQGLMACMCIRWHALLT